MISMPLIDAPDVPLDSELIVALAEWFTTRDGLIIDDAGLTWMLWRMDGLEAWWRFFEEIIDAPMGRKLANAACDEEEWLLSAGQLDSTGWFKRKKSERALANRWWLHGWGEPSIDPPGILSVGLNPVFAGLLQAGIERLESRRFRMKWVTKSSDLCMLELEDSQDQLPASKSVTDSVSTGEPYQIEVESGWRLDGQRCHLIPTGIFNRLQESCAGLTANMNQDERMSWPDVDEGFLAMAQASKRLFIAGEELFLAADSEGWMDSCAHIFGTKGLSQPSNVKSLDDNGGVELTFSALPNPALTVGMLAGAWERCEGRPVKVEFITNQADLSVRLTSRHEIV